MTQGKQVYDGLVCDNFSGLLHIEAALSHLILALVWIGSKVGDVDSALFGLHLKSTHVGKFFTISRNWAVPPVSASLQMSKHHNTEMKDMVNTTAYIEIFISESVSLGATPKMLSVSISIMHRVLGV